MKKIFLDIDGVVRDLSYGHYPMWWQNEYHRTYASMSKDEFMSKPPCIDPLKLAFEPAGYITSSSKPITWQEEWLVHWGWPLAQIYMAATPEDKRTVALDAQADLVFDDAIHNFNAFWKVGIPCILITQPYNLRHNVGPLRCTHEEMAKLPYTF